MCKSLLITSTSAGHIMSAPVIVHGPFASILSVLLPSPSIVAESSFKWDDVGTWTSVANHFPVDKRNNICIGRTLLHDVADSIVVGDCNHHVMALVGVKDLIVVNNGNTTLICNRNRAQDIKKIVQRLT
jgi:hypothetical protein